MAGDLHMMLSPQKGNLLPVEGLNNVLPLGGVWVYTKDCNHPVFPKNGENVFCQTKLTFIIRTGPSWMMMVSLMEGLEKNVQA